MQHQAEVEHRQPDVEQRQPLAVEEDLLVDEAPPEDAVEGLVDEALLEAVAEDLADEESPAGAGELSTTQLRTTDRKDRSVSKWKA